MCCRSPNRGIITIIIWSQCTLRYREQVNVTCRKSFYFQVKTTGWKNLGNFIMQFWAFSTQTSTTSRLSLFAAIRRLSVSPALTKQVGVFSSSVSALLFPALRTGVTELLTSPRASDFRRALAGTPGRFGTPLRNRLEFQPSLCGTGTSSTLIIFINS